MFKLNFDLILHLFIDATVITSDDALQGYDPLFMVGCYFPAEFQGEFVTQVSGKDTSNEPIQYSTINITFNAVPVWGYCHRRVGDNVLLMDRWVHVESSNLTRIIINCYNLPYFMITFIQFRLSLDFNDNLLVRIE